MRTLPVALLMVAMAFGLAQAQTYIEVDSYTDSTCRNISSVSYYKLNDCIYSTLLGSTGSMWTMNGNVATQTKYSDTGCTTVSGNATAYTQGTCSQATAYAGVVTGSFLTATIYGDSGCSIILVNHNYIRLGVCIPSSNMATMNSVSGSTYTSVMYNSKTMCTSVNTTMNTGLGQCTSFSAGSISAFALINSAVGSFVTSMFLRAALAVAAIGFSAISARR